MFQNGWRAVIQRVAKIRREMRVFASDFCDRGLVSNLEEPILS